MPASPRCSTCCDADHGGTSAATSSSSRRRSRLREAGVDAVAAHGRGGARPTSTSSTSTTCSGRPRCCRDLRAARRRWPIGAVVRVAGVVADGSCAPMARTGPPRPCAAEGRQDRGSRASVVAVPAPRPAAAPTSSCPTPHAEVRRAATRVPPRRPRRRMGRRAERHPPRSVAVRRAARRRAAGDAGRARSRRRRRRRCWPASPASSR